MNQLIIASQYAFWTLLLVLAANTAYFFVFSIAGMYHSRRVYITNPKTPPLKALVIFPSYREDQVILESVRNMMRQDYPSHSYKVMVIADSLKDETLNEIKCMGGSVYELPASDKRNKASAINEMLSHNTESYDICVVMDADNQVEHDFLKRLNPYFLNGVKVLQARRVAKNNSNNLSLLDSYSETINNHIFRQGQRVLSFSSSLIGSGMAFDFDLFQRQMNGMNVFSGFDKELELRLLDSKIKIEYAPEIKVYDEKVASDKVFVNQRRRWVYAQLYFLQKNAFKAVYKAVTGNFDYANKVVQFALLPRIICIGLASLLLLASTMIGTLAFTITAIIVSCLGLALFIPVREQIFQRRSVTLVLSVFSAFGQMIVAMGTSGRAAGKFLHTPHHTK